MFDPTEHREIFVKSHRSKGKTHAFVRLTPFPLVEGYTAARNPRLQFMRTIRSRGVKDEYAIVQLSDMSVACYYPPMNQRGKRRGHP